MINSLKVKLLNSLCTMYFKYTQVGTIVLTIWSRFFFYLSNRLIFTHGHILHMDIFNLKVKKYALHYKIIQGVYSGRRGRTWGRL